jgi:hypothetical protein
MGNKQTSGLRIVSHCAGVDHELIDIVPYNNILYKYQDQNKIVFLIASGV